MKRWIAALALGYLAAMPLTAFAQVTDPQTALKELNEYQTKTVTEARSSGKQLDVKALQAGILERAQKAVAGVDVEKIDPKQGLDWARLYATADMYKQACRAAERFLATGPEAAQKFDAQSIMLSSCSELGEGKMVSDLLKETTPPSVIGGYMLASNAAYQYSEVIEKKLGVDAALTSLKDVEAKLSGMTPANDREKAQLSAAKNALSSTRIELLANAGRKTDALAEADRLIAAAAEAKDVPGERTLKALRLRTAMVDAPAPAIASERAYGEFKGLDSLKGKVVLVDFFAHWCGPCIASFPEMKKLYAELKEKGLEIVGVTTYYGYYRRENAEKRDMPKDTEFAKMGEFIKEFSLPWPVVYGERSNFEAYGITGIPHVTVIDRKGNVRKIKIGYSPSTFGEFRAYVEKLLAEKG